MSVFTNLAARAYAAATTPTRRGVSLADVVADVTKIDALALTCAEIVENELPHGTPGEIQVIVGAVIVVATIVQSVLAQISKAEAVAAANVAKAARATKKAAK